MLSSFSSFIFYICSSFNDAFSNSDNMASNDWMIALKWKGCGRKRLPPKLRYFFGICLERLGKMTINWLVFGRYSFTGLLAILTEVSRGVPQSLQANSGIVARLGHDHLFSNPFQIMIHPSSIHSMLYTRPVQRGAHDILSWRPNLLCRL
jgi:hypothetical protein